MRERNSQEHKSVGAWTYAGKQVTAGSGGEVAMCDDRGLWSGKRPLPCHWGGGNRGTGQARAIQIPAK